MNAQRARGVDFGEGSLVQKMKAVIPLLIPLFVSSFNRAEDLATPWKQEATKAVKEEQSIDSSLASTRYRAAMVLVLFLYY